jgi:hypothetical protein
VPGHLANGARTTPTGTTQIFATTTIVFGDTVLVPQMVASAARGNARHNANDGGDEGQDGGRRGTLGHGRSRPTQHDGHHHQHEPDLIRRGSDARTIGCGEPIELIPRQDLAEQAQATPDAQTKDRVAKAHNTTVTQTIAPTTGRDRMLAADTTATAAGCPRVVDNERTEPLSGHDATSRLRSRRRRKIEQEKKAKDNRMSRSLFDLQ